MQNLLLRKKAKGIRKNEIAIRKYVQQKSSILMILDFRWSMMKREIPRKSVRKMIENEL